MGETNASKFYDGSSAPKHEDDQQHRYIIFTLWVREAALTSDQNTDFSFFFVFFCPSYMVPFGYDSNV